MEQSLGKARLVISGEPKDSVVFNDTLRGILRCADDEVCDAAALELSCALEQGVNAGRQTRFEPCDLFCCHDNIQPQNYGNLP